MGNDQSKKKYGPSLSPDQKECIFNSLEAITPGKSSTISSDTLQAIWEESMSDGLMRTFLTYLFRRSKTITLQEYEMFFYSMVEGGLELRARTVLALLGIDKNIPPKNFQTYVSDLIDSYLLILRAKCPEAYSSWTSRDLTQKSDIDTISYFIIKDIKYCDDGMVPVDELEHWLHRSPFLKEISDSVLNVAFGMELYDMRPHLPKANKGSTLLRIPMVLLLSHLTREPAHNWRLLYSSSNEAHSWQIFHNKLCHEGPTLVLVQDKAGPLLGGYASESWRVNPNFYGSEDSFLFRLRPDLRVCMPTGYNHNFQYLNSGAATLPNGLGMGGQLNYFGFFLSSEFGPGSVSKTCTTFSDYVPLASQLEFTFSQLEVWALGEPDVMEEGVRQVGQGGQLVMQRDPGATAIMELVGKGGHAKAAGELPEPGYD